MYVFLHHQKCTAALVAGDKPASPEELALLQQLAEKVTSGSEAEKEAALAAGALVPAAYLRPRGTAALHNAARSGCDFGPRPRRSQPVGGSCWKGGPARRVRHCYMARPVHAVGG